MAFRNSSDAPHARALSFFDKERDPEIIWTPWQRVELFNAIRQAERQGFLRVGSASALIHSLEQEVRLGYWTHVEFNWTETIRTANELSAAHSQNFLIRGMDLFHVAIALETAAEIFVTFDADQAALAKAAGLQIFE